MTHACGYLAHWAATAIRKNRLKVFEKVHLPRHLTRRGEGAAAVRALVDEAAFRDLEQLVPIERRRVNEIDNILYHFSLDAHIEIRVPRE